MGRRIHIGFRGPSTSLLACSVGLAEYPMLPSKKIDLSAGGNPVSNVKGGGWPQKYREMSYLSGTAAASYAVPVMWGGVDCKSN